MQNWTIAGEWIEPMKRIQCLGTSFYAHLMDSMLVLTNSFGDPLRTQANLLTNANAPVADYLFTGDHMTRYLQRGDFKFGTTPADIFIIYGPDEQMMIEDYNGRAPLNGHTMRLNIYKYYRMVRDNFNGWFPENDIGLQNLKTLLGKVVLHEALHSEGFKHPDRPLGEYDPTVTYWRTFPEVAEEAYNRLRGRLPEGAFQLTGNGVSDGLSSHCGTFD